MESEFGEYESISMDILLYKLYARLWISFLYFHGIYFFLFHFLFLFISLCCWLLPPEVSKHLRCGCGEGWRKWVGKPKRAWSCVIIIKEWMHSCDCIKWRMADYNVKDMSENIIILKMSWYWEASAGYLQSL